MKRVGLYTLAVACMLVGWIVIGRFTWQAGLGAFLYLGAGYAVYEAVDDAKWNRVRVAKKRSPDGSAGGSLRKLSTELYNMTPEQRYKDIQGEQIKLIAEDEWLHVSTPFGEDTDGETDDR